ncbi:MAG: dockerin type I domain-containing protein [Candidatus Zixiibacteriota bacterium]
MKSIIFGMFVPFFLLLLFAAMAMADEESGEQINWQVISGGGSVNGSSTNYRLGGTIAQTAVGLGTSTSYKINSGFWQDFSGGGTGCCNVPGDANDNNAVNILDVTFTISYLYKGGAAPACMDEADANGNNALNILDVTYTISYLYKGGAAPICGTTGS